MSFFGTLYSMCVYMYVCICNLCYRVKEAIYQNMSWSGDVKVYVTHIIDPLNFYARIGDGMLDFT